MSAGGEPYRGGLLTGVFLLPPLSLRMSFLVMLEDLVLVLEPFGENVGPDTLL